MKSLSAVVLFLLTRPDHAHSAGQCSCGGRRICGRVLGQYRVRCKLHAAIERRSWLLRNRMSNASEVELPRAMCGQAGGPRQEAEDGTVGAYYSANLRISGLQAVRR